MRKARRLAEEVRVFVAPAATTVARRAESPCALAFTIYEFLRRSSDNSEEEGQSLT